MSKVSVDHAIDLLNEALKRDPAAINALYNKRVKCNDDLAKHPTIQVGWRRPLLGKTHNSLSFLGMLNGIFGISTKRVGYGFICVDVNTKTGKIIKFARTPRT